MGPSQTPVRANDTERWRVTSGPTTRRLDAWSEILAKTHLAFDVRATHRTPAEFRAGVTRRRFGDLTLVDCVAAPFLGRRSTAVIEAGGDQRRQESIVGFQFVGKGVEMVREGGRELALTAGDVVLWDGLQPTEVEIIEPFCKRTLLFPRERVLAVCPRLGEQDAFPPLDRSGPARLLVRFMNALAAELPQLDPAARAAAATAALAASSITLKPGETPASSGKRRSSFSQKAWMVWIFRPPGVSRARANRARARDRSSEGSPSLARASASWASFITAQPPSWSNSRRCISAAPALV